MNAGNIPNFLIIGAAKAATTTLASMLSRHPQACIAAGKEPHFFSMDWKYGKGWAWYQSCFRHCGNKLAIGDASTSYSRIRHFPKTLERIRRHVPDVRIIYMVRHPLERIVSAYVERATSIDAKHAYPSVNHAVRAEPMIVDSSRYWEVFQHYRSEIDESRIKVIWFEDFIANTQDVFREICGFLEIDDTIEIRPLATHQNSRTQVLSRLNGGPASCIDETWDPETLRWVCDQLRDDISRFLRYFGKPPDYWADFPC